jgi:peptide/nickel transport system ATP-binding protein/oligopeptide transport system ATP-binding protein
MSEPSGAGGHRHPPVIEVEGLKKHYRTPRGLFSRRPSTVYAVDGVSFAIEQGRSLGLVGESGCGKSTVGRTLLRLTEPTAGTIRLNGEEISGLDEEAMRPHRRRMQIVFQDPYSSLNPKLKVGRIVGEPLRVHGLAEGKALEEQVEELFRAVGLPADAGAKYAHQFSGGQRQRIGIARALALSPDLIVCDEPVSALDVSVQAQVINLLLDLQQQRGVSYLFIAHDLAVVQYVSHDVAVMYLGRIVEMASRRTLFGGALHPYTQMLLAAVPSPHVSAKANEVVPVGELPSPMNPPSGCHFHTRCPFAMERCRGEAPELREIAPGHRVACHLVE